MKHQYALGLVFCLVLSSQPAAAFVRTKTYTDPGLPMSWDHSCLSLTVHPETTPAGLAPTRLVQALSAAVASWTRTCTPITIAVNTALADPVVAMMANPSAALLGYDRERADNQNHVFFVRGDTWCDEIDGTKICHGEGTLALTTIFASQATGRIVDADLQLNAVHHTWGDLAQGDRGTHDLQNTLTHELGHVLGFDHTCRSAGERLAIRRQLSFNLKRPIDDGFLARWDVDARGQTVPLCETAQTEMKEATMTNTTRAGSLDLRSLTDDDIQAICTTYGHAQGLACQPPPPPTQAETDAGGGCQLTTRGRAGLPLTAMTLLLMGALRRRRRTPR